jgi:hypothetical protein
VLIQAYDPTSGAMDPSKQPQLTASQATQEPTLIDEEHEALAKRVLRKIDWRLIPLMFITYMLNFMDKTILGSASVFGLREDTVREPSSWIDCTQKLIVARRNS